MPSLSVFNYLYEKKHDDRPNRESDPYCSFGWTHRKEQREKAKNSARRLCHYHWVKQYAL